jgi:hypothetical protein
MMGADASPPPKPAFERPMNSTPMAAKIQEWASGTGTVYEAPRGKSRRDSSSAASSVVPRSNKPVFIVGGTVYSSCLDRPPEALGHLANVTLLSTQISSAVGSLAAAGTINRSFLHNPYPHLVANLQPAVHPTDVFFGGRDQSAEMQMESLLAETAFRLRVQLTTAPQETATRPRVGIQSILENTPLQPPRCVVIGVNGRPECSPSRRIQTAKD